MLHRSQWARAFVGLVLASSAVGAARAQDRETKVRNDRKQLAEDDTWVYNDLERGIAAARAAQKPLLVVLRCIP
jgi:hypothetical protein